jgi:hypothetical protein
MESIKEILKSFSDKVSSYQIFTFLFPGAVFLGILKTSYTEEMPELNIWEKLFLCYTIGMIISRIGTLVIEGTMIWLNRWINALDKIEYKNIILAERRDTKLNMLIQISNTYRTMAAVFLTILIAAAVNKISSLGFDFSCDLLWFCVAMILLFVLSFRKQYSYAKKRADFVSSENIGADN